ncbi:hypothetical protein HTIA_1353 [Halorhabdus tiamatea SARL4B]|uniref:Uncharacterized protein n=1 Tax=Halorhabdus tiamatea SARL4B TaxID=1033806 RepID=S6D8G0_9EURY|nr:hypothetical protein HTIA_1353 [Halorhabdus tiamatea SARL4B]
MDVGGHGRSCPLPAVSPSAPAAIAARHRLRSTSGGQIRRTAPPSIVDHCSSGSANTAALLENW